MVKRQAQRGLENDLFQLITWFDYMSCDSKCLVTSLNRLARPQAIASVVCFHGNSAAVAPVSYAIHYKQKEIRDCFVLKKSPFNRDLLHKVLTTISA